MSPYNVLYIFRADYGPPNFQLVCSSLGKTNSPFPSFSQLPAVPYVGLGSCGLFPSSLARDFWSRCPEHSGESAVYLTTSVEIFGSLYHGQKWTQSIVKTLVWWMAQSKQENPSDKGRIITVGTGLAQAIWKNPCLKNPKTLCMGICASIWHMYYI